MSCSTSTWPPAASSGPHWPISSSAGPYSRATVPPARITLEHAAPRKRIDVVGYLRVEAEGEASEPGDVRCGIPGFDHPGTELHGDMLRSTDPALRWEVRGRRHAAFTTDFDYRCGP